MAWPLKAQILALALACGCSFQPAPHAPFPQVPNLGGPLLSQLQLVTITYADYPYRGEVEAFGDWVVGSDWLTTVGTEYGIGPGTHVAKVELAQDAPAAPTTAEVAAFLIAEMDAGVVPTPTADSQLLYLLYLPPSSQNGDPCALGYHDHATVGSIPFAYAAIGSCPNSAEPAPFVLQSNETSASHEIIEAATDPFHDSFVIRDPNNPWTAIDGELADLCEGSLTNDSSFTVTRVWSNAAAAAGAAPCVPSPQGPYFDVSTGNLAAVAPGQTTTLDVTGWSTGDTPPWFISASSASPDGSHPFPVDLKPTLDTSVLSNGQVAHLTVTVPATAVPGSVLPVEMQSIAAQPFVFGAAAFYLNTWSQWIVGIPVACGAAPTSPADGGVSGLLTLTRLVPASGSVTRTLSAQFVAGPAPTAPACQGPSAGACCLTDTDQPPGPPAPAVGAGTLMATDGALVLGQLDETCGQLYDPISSWYAWASGDTLTVTADAGPEGSAVGAFTVAAKAPSEPRFDFNFATPVAVEADWTLSWTPESDAETMQLSLDGFATGRLITCSVADSAGALTIPQALLGQLHAGGSGSLSAIRSATANTAVLRGQVILHAQQALEWPLTFK